MINRDMCEYHSVIIDPNFLYSSAGKSPRLGMYDRRHRLCHRLVRKHRQGELEVRTQLHQGFHPRGQRGSSPCTGQNQHSSVSLVIAER